MLRKDVFTTISWLDLFRRYLLDYSLDRNGETRILVMCFLSAAAVTWTAHRQWRTEPCFRTNWCVWSRSLVITLRRINVCLDELSYRMLFRYWQSQHYNQSAVSRLQSTLGLTTTLITTATTLKNLTTLATMPQSLVDETIFSDSVTSSKHGLELIVNVSVSLNILTVSRQRFMNMSCVVHIQLQA